MMSGGMMANAMGGMPGMGGGMGGGMSAGMAGNSARDRDTCSASLAVMPLPLDNRCRPCGGAPDGESGVPCRATAVMNVGMNGMNGLTGMQGQRLPAQSNGGGSNLTEKLYLQMMVQGNKPGGGTGFAPQGFGNNGFDAAARRDPSTHPKFRTKPCRYFASSGGCKNGDRCTFLHMEMTSEQFGETRVAEA